jgi:hypothetical protein
MYRFKAEVVSMEEDDYCIVVGLATARRIRLVTWYCRTRRRMTTRTKSWAWRTPISRSVGS